MAEWLAMSGYGAYVWASYGVATLILLTLVAWSWRHLRASQTLLERLERAAPRRQAAPAGDDAPSDSPPT